jgi:hypothetical protein
MLVWFSPWSNRCYLFLIVVLSQRPRRLPSTSSLPRWLASGRRYRHPTARCRRPSRRRRRARLLCPRLQQQKQQQKYTQGPAPTLQRRRRRSRRGRRLAPPSPCPRPRGRASRKATAKARCGDARASAAFAPFATSLWWLVTVAADVFGLCLQWWVARGGRVVRCWLWRRSAICLWPFCAATFERHSRARALAGVIPARAPPAGGSGTGRPALPRAGCAGASVSARARVLSRSCRAV